MSSSKIIAVIIAGIALIWIGSGFLEGQNSTGLSDVSDGSEAEVSLKADRKKDELLEVRIRETTAQNYIDDVVLTGRSQAIQRVRLRTEISGQVQKLYHQEGDSVKVGDVLADIELGDRSARQAEAQQRVNQRRIEYNAAKKLENKGFNSKVRLAQSLAELEDARAALKQASISVQKTKISAPFDGVIAMQDVEIGDYLSVGDPLFTIVNLNPIEFVGFVSERRIQDLRVGTQADVELLDGDKIKAKVSYIAPAADAQTRTFRVIVAADNKDLSIKEGLTTKVHIPVGSRRAHKISPAILALNDIGQVGVKIVDADNVVAFVPVQILADTTEAMWVIGPPETARLITVGQEFVSAGQTVKPVPATDDGLL